MGYMKKGDRVTVSGDSAELWIEDYNVRVSTEATVEETPGPHDKKVLLTLDKIDDFAPHTRDFSCELGAFLC